MVPFGAALAGKLMGKKVVYHIHEVSISPKILNFILKGIAYKTATDVIFVSKYVKNQFNFKEANTCVIYNALSEDFVNVAKEIKPTYEKNSFEILMICSLKGFKGVWEFIELSKLLTNLKFELVLNASSKEITKTFLGETLPENLSIYPASQSVHDFYRRTNLLLNLSHPDKWIETFGLTVLEAMYYGKPAIVPPVGGITELIEDGINGYKISVHNKDELINRILFIAENQEHYKSLSTKALERSTSFNFEIMDNLIEKIINSPHKKN
jgi:glycosyltransferase involved in cell wall biosynthesis